MTTSDRVRMMLRVDSENNEQIWTHTQRDTHTPSLSLLQTAPILQNLISRENLKKSGMDGYVSRGRLLHISSVKSTRRQKNSKFRWYKNKLVREQKTDMYKCTLKWLIMRNAKERDQRSRWLSDVDSFHTSHGLDGYPHGAKICVLQCCYFHIHCLDDMYQIMKSYSLKNQWKRKV